MNNRLGKRGFGLFSMAAVLAAMFTAGATAQDSVIVDKFLKCGEITDDGARLRCLDQLLSTTNEARAKYAEVVQEKKKADFGKIEEKDPEQIEDIKAKITRYTQNRTSKNYTFYLDNGQVWRTNLSGKRMRLPSKASHVLIKRAVFGSFAMIVYNDKGRDSSAVKVTRVR
jgi:polyhydroxyalkanoate synthesis regulator phasin